MQADSACKESVDRRTSPPIVASRTGLPENPDRPAVCTATGGRRFFMKVRGVGRTLHSLVSSRQLGRWVWPLLLAGCSTWQQPDLSTSELPKPPESPERVALEIRTLYVNSDDAEFHSQLWPPLDEQHLPVELQNRLLQNGFRCGLASTQLPTAVLERLQMGPEQLTDSLAEPASLSRFESLRNMSAGRRYEIISPVIRDELVVLKKGREGTTGKRFAQAQCLLALYCFPQPDGTVRLRVVPEVHHGPHRQRFTASEAVLQIQAKRDAEVFTEIAIEANLKVGQSLIVSCTSPSRGLGDKFFQEDFSGQTRQKLVLLRVTQSPENQMSLPGVFAG